MQKIKVSNESGTHMAIKENKEKAQIKHSSNLSVAKRVTKPAKQISSQAFSASHRDVFANKMNQDLIMAVHSQGNEKFGAQ